MKKMLSVILCVLMLSGMCACGGSNSNQASQTPVSPGNSTSEIEEITFSLGDVSGTGTFLVPAHFWNRMHSSFHRR